jgi:hypothetical protein
MSRTSRGFELELLPKKQSKVLLRGEARRMLSRIRKTQPPREKRVTEAHVGKSAILTYIGPDGSTLDSIGHF